jgi:hypothetical protein
MASRSVPAAPAVRAGSRPPYETIVAVLAVLALPLWFVEIHRALRLRAHPLLLHAPVISCPSWGSRR